MDNRELELRTVAEKYELNPDSFIKALNYSFSMKLIGRSYDPPIVLKTTVKNKKERKERITKEVNARLGEYISVFSKERKGKLGLIPGALGTKATVIKNLIKWLDSNEDYTFDDIITAAEYYVDLQKKNQYTYLVSANRFIFANGGESKLSALIDESMTEPLTTKIYTAI